MKMIALAAMLLLSTAARALGPGCQATTGSLALEKVQGTASGTQILGCINRSLDVISNGAAVSSANATVQFSTVIITQNGVSSAPYVANFYPNAPLIMVIKVNAAGQYVAQNLSTGTAATMSAILTGALGGNTSFYLETFVNSPNFNVAGYGAEKSSATGIASSDSDIMIEAGLNGGLNGAASEKIIFVSSNPVAANIAGWVMEATASGPGAWVFQSSGTFNGAGGLKVLYGLTASTGTFSGGITAGSGTFTGGGGVSVAYGLTAATGTFTSGVTAGSGTFIGANGVSVTYGLTAATGTFTQGVTAGSGTFSGGGGVSVTYGIVAATGTFTAGVTAASGTFTNGITASSGTFTAIGAAQTSVQTSSGILIGGSSNPLCFGSVSSANCMYSPPAAGGGTVGGTGIANVVPVWTAASTLGTGSGYITNYSTGVAISTGVSVGGPPTVAPTAGEGLNVFNGVFTSSSVAPTPSACTGQSFAPSMGANSSNQAGVVNMGGCSGVTLTFSKPWRAISSCVIVAGSNNVAVEVSALSNTAFSGIWAGGLNSIYYACFGEP